MTDLLLDIALVITAFAAMEFVAAVAHRHVYHGPGWIFHASHHEKRTGILERNDVFPAFFATVAIAVMFLSLNVPAVSFLFPVSIGVSLYGMTYFAIHDLVIHRRAGRIRVRSRYLKRVFAAHVMHHRYGAEPYGLLYIPKAMRRRTRKPEARPHA